MKRLIYPVLLFFSLLTFTYADEEGYRLGHGIRIGNTPLYAGGYFSFEYENIDDGSETVKLDDLSLMIYGETERFDYMMELEANDIYSEVLSGPDQNESVNFHLHIERFYLDYKQENYTLRAGKFNSFIGFWNRVPINVLRDTTSNPEIVQYLFPHFTTGLNIAYHPEWWGESLLNVILQETKDLDAYVNDAFYNNMDIDRHYGLGLEISSGVTAYRLNAGTYRLRDGEVRYYAAGAFSYEGDQFRLQGEAGIQFDEDESTIPYMGYVQGVYRIAQGHEAIIRVESYEDRVRGMHDTFGVFGYTWRPLFPVALKGEYQIHRQSLYNRLLFSVSMMF